MMYEIAILSGLILSPAVALFVAWALRRPLVRANRASRGLTAMALLSGTACVAAIVLTYEEPILGWSLPPDDFELGFLIPLKEELLKAVAALVLIRLAAVRDEVDGLFVGATVGLGFALVENHRFFTIADSEELLIQLYLTRTVLSTTGHALTTGLVGSCLGHIRVAPDARTIALAAVSFVLAVALHGGWNLYGGTPFSPTFLVASFVQLGLFAALMMAGSRRLRTIHAEEEFAH